MGFKLFILCLGFLAVAIAASPVCKCGPEEKDSVKKYHLKLSKDGKEYDEEIEIDTENETETFHVPKTSPNEESADMVYDFKKNVLMIRLPQVNSCFMINSTGDAPKPAELAALLEANNNHAVQDDAPSTDLKFKKVASLNDRSELSEEMAELCKKQAIYQVVEGHFTDKMSDVNMEQAHARRTKRRVCGWLKICTCLEGWRICNRYTGKCFVLCTKEYCRDLYTCVD